MYVCVLYKSAETIIIIFFFLYYPFIVTIEKTRSCVQRHNIRHPVRKTVHTHIYIGAYPSIARVGKTGEHEDCHETLEGFWGFCYEKGEKCTRRAAVLEEKEYVRRRFRQTYIYTYMMSFSRDYLRYLRRRVVIYTCSCPHSDSDDVHATYFDINEIPRSSRT